MAIQWLTILILAVASSVAAAPMVRLNEVVMDSLGGNPELEYVELIAQPGAPVGGLSVVFIESMTTLPEVPPGTIVRRLDIPQGERADARGLYLLCNERVMQEYGVRPGVLWPNDAKIPNDYLTVVLVPTQAAPGEGGHVNDRPRLAQSIIDSVAIVGNMESVIYFNAPRVGPDGQFTPAGAVRVQDGYDTDSLADWALSDINGPPESYNTPLRPNRLPDHIIALGAANVGDQGHGEDAVGESAPGEAAPAAAATRSVRTGNLTWYQYQPMMAAEVTRQQGTAFIYVRSSMVQRCRAFEQAYLLHPVAEPLLQGKPLFFLNSESAEQSYLARELGVYRVPTMVRLRANRPPEYLIVGLETTPQQVYDFLVAP